MDANNRLEVQVQGNVAATAEIVRPRIPNIRDPVMPEGGTMYELQAMQDCLSRKRGSCSTLSDEISRMYAEDPDTACMHRLDGCLGVTKQSSFPFFHFCSTVTGAQKLPWFKFDLRQHVGPLLINDLTQIPVGSHISVDDGGYGVNFRNHAIYVGQMEEQSYDGIQPVLVQVPTVVHMQRSAANEKSATFRFSSLSAFHNGKRVFMHSGSSDDANKRAIDSVNGRACFYDFYAANSEHWASWCVGDGMVSTEANNAKRKMHFAFWISCVCGGVLAAAAAVENLKL